MIDGKIMFFIDSLQKKVIVLLELHPTVKKARGGGAVGLERSPRKRKVGCSNPSRERPKL